MKLRARSPKDIPAKPGYLIAYEMVKEHSVPLVSGGLMDQPHLWLLEYKVIDQTVKLFAPDTQPSQGSQNAA